MKTKIGGPDLHSVFSLGLSKSQFPDKECLYNLSFLGWGQIRVLATLLDAQEENQTVADSISDYSCGTLVQSKKHLFWISSF